MHYKPGDIIIDMTCISFWKSCNLLNDCLFQDTGVSVRKRVIKILKDICLEYPGYSKIPELCVKMIRRINDEEGIRKLVMEVFQNMWFVPVRERSRSEDEEELLVTRARNITDVVVTCQRDSGGLDWFENLLNTVSTWLWVFGKSYLCVPQLRES